jgi:hypothetical protein
MWGQEARATNVAREVVKPHRGGGAINRGCRHARGDKSSRAAWEGPTPARLGKTTVNLV